MKLKEITRLLDAEVISDSAAPDADIEMVYSSDLMSDVLFFAPADCILITSLTHPHVIRTAEITRINTIIFVQNKKPDSETVELAKKKNIHLLVTPLSKFAACGRLYLNGIRDCFEK
ncbi:MAG: hypothetical protein HY759_06480 [Nitrospirae bacterium]|nr:hypothetical protein [Nitrospirota bacterium]